MEEHRVMKVAASHKQLGRNVFMGEYVTPAASGGSSLQIVRASGLMSLEKENSAACSPYKIRVIHGVVFEPGEGPPPLNLERDVDFQIGERTKGRLVLNHSIRCYEPLRHEVHVDTLTELSYPPLPPVEVPVTREQQVIYDAMPPAYLPYGHVGTQLEPMVPGTPMHVGHVDRAEVDEMVIEFVKAMMDKHGGMHVGQHLDREYLVRVVTWAIMGEVGPVPEPETTKQKWTLETADDVGQIVVKAALMRALGVLGGEPT